MKYKLKRPLPWAKEGTVVEADFTGSGNGNISYSFIAEWGRDKGQRVYHGWYLNSHEAFSDWFEEVDERWKPERDEKYFFITVQGYIFSDFWNETPGELDIHRLGNCFKKKEEAERAAEQIKALLKEFHKNNP